MKMPLTGSVLDHAGRRIPYKLRTDSEDRSQWVCYFDFNDTGNFAPFGRGGTVSAAIVDAKTNWYKYDAL